VDVLHRVAGEDQAIRGALREEGQVVRRVPRARDRVDAGQDLPAL
jgi:hypothetical protein